MSCRDDHERAIFLRALNLPGGSDERHPFDAERFLEGFAEEPARIIRAEDDPVLDGLARVAGRPGPRSWPRMRNPSSPVLRAGGPGSHARPEWHGGGPVGAGGRVTHVARRRADHGHYRRDEPRCGVPAS